MAGMKVMFVLVAVAIHMVHCQEVSSVCLDSEFSCTSDNKCIYKTWLCDGENDCSDSSDEKYCNPKTQPFVVVQANDTTESSGNYEGSGLPTTIETTTQMPKVPTTIEKKSTTAPVDPACEKLVLSGCDNVNYANIRLPNVFGHSNQNQVRRAMRRWAPILQTGCSAELNEFVCRVYAPPCKPSRLPCRSVCKKIKKQCNKILKKQKLKWPSSLRCSSLPKKRCFDGKASSTTAKPTTTKRHKKHSIPKQITSAPDHKTSSYGRCEKVKIPSCIDVGYNFTSFPNYFNHRYQEEAALEVSQFSPLVKVGCSKYLQLFLCSLYAPMCFRNNHGVREFILPCRSLCEEARGGCSGIMNKFGFTWPESMNCSRFPTNEKTLCVTVPGNRGSTIKTPPTPSSSNVSTQIQTPPLPIPSKASNQSCRKIVGPFCLSMSYNFTFFPNFAMQSDEVAADRNIGSLMPLIKSGCSKYIEKFLCSVYVPKCSNTFGVVPPCKELCMKAKSTKCTAILNQFGFSWAPELECSRFPDYDDSKHHCLPLHIQSVSPTRGHSTSQPPTFNQPSTVLPTTRSKCGGLLTNVEGQLTSPNYPEEYPKDVTCTWKITLPREFNLITISINTMRLEQDRNCFYDYVMIVDKMLNQVGPRHCGTYRLPYVIPVRGNEVSIVFVSDKNTSKKGFSLTYKGMKN